MKIDRLIFLAHLLICALIVLTSCTHVGVARSKKDGTLVAGVTSVMGEVISKDVKITTAEGDIIEIGALATHNPDRAVTGAVKDVAIFGKLAPVLHTAVKGENAIRLKGTDNPDFIPDNPENIPVDPQFIPPPQ